MKKIILSLIVFLLAAVAYYRLVYFYRSFRRPYPNYENELLPPITYSELRLFDGNKVIRYVSLFNVVYNVTQAREFQEGGKYMSWSGHQITSAVATNSISNLDQYNQKFRMSSDQSEQGLKFLSKFQRLFLKVGRLVQDSEAKSCGIDQSPRQYSRLLDILK